MATTRDRIITATNELFRRRGYNGTSLSQISEASGVTIGSIYHCFPGGKEALAVAVLDATGAVYRELFESIVSEAADPAAGFVAFFDGAAAVLAETDFIDPCPIGTIAREVANTNEPIRKAAQQVFDSWIATAREHLVAGGVALEVAADLAAVFVSLVEGMFVLSRTQRATAPLSSAGRCFAALVEQAIDGSAPSGTSPVAAQRGGLGAGTRPIV